MTNDKAAPASGSIMVVGGGIAGLTTAIEAAEVGYWNSNPLGCGHRRNEADV